MKNGKFYIATFGCRTNQADSAALREEFQLQEFEETLRPSEADVVVVNSCTVTHRSDQQVRQLTRRMCRESPGARIFITGCYAQREPLSLAGIPGVDAVVGNSHKGELVRIATGSGQADASPLGHHEIAAIYRDDFKKIRSMEVTAAAQTGGRTRPFVKIQDGCDAKCSYCIIPQVRGPSRSVPPELILDQVRCLIDQGFKEVVLTGIHIGSYGIHFKNRVSLDQLLQQIVSLSGLRRLRVSSIEPMKLSRRVIELAASCDRIAPHFHICLQSGSDSVLRRMRRPYTIRRFSSIVEEIDRRLPDAGIGTDIITGFPGETEADHRQTVDFVQQMPFTYLHVFPYSDRPGTVASQMPDQVRSQDIRARADELRCLSEEKNRAFRKRFAGKKLSVLTLTEKEEGLRTALSGNYLKAKVDDTVPANCIIEGTVLREDGKGFQILKI